MSFKDISILSLGDQNGLCNFSRVYYERSRWHLNLHFYFSSGIHFVLQRGSVWNFGRCIMRNTYVKLYWIWSSAILSIFIKLPFFIKIFVLSISELPLKTDFTDWTHKENWLVSFYLLYRHVAMTSHRYKVIATHSYQITYSITKQWNFSLKYSKNEWKRESWS